MKMVSLGDFLTDEEIAQCIFVWGLWQKNINPQAKTYAEVIEQQIIAPNLERINKALGQENDPAYLAYMVEYVMSQAAQKEFETPGGRKL